MISKILRGLLALGVTAVLPVVLLLAPEPAPRFSGAEPPEFSVSVDPSALRLVCAGAAIRVGGEAGTEVGLIERVSVADLQLFTAETVDAVEIEVPGERANVTSPADAADLKMSNPIQVSVDSNQQSTELIAAWQYQELDQQRLAGSLATYCGQPERAHWFAAGSLGAGDDTVLSVYNPSRVEVSIALRVHAAGRSELSEFALAPMQSELIPLAALAAGNAEFAVELTATGRVASWLQHRSNRGLSATGVTIANGQPEPATAITIPSILVRGSELAPFPELATAVLRIFNPQETAAEVLVEVVRAAGGFGVAERVLVNPGQIQEVPLAGLVDGDYAAFISSNIEIVAGLLNPVVLDLNRIDFAWLGAGEPFAVPFVIPVGDIPARLVLANSEQQPTVVTVTQGNQQRTVRLPARSVRAIDLAPNREARVRPGGAVHVALQLLGAGYAVVQPTENSNLGSSVVVRVQ